MEYFPFYMDVTDKRFLVVGGGMESYHKITVISQYQVKIMVVAKEICDKLNHLISEHGSQIKSEIRMYNDRDLDGVDYVIVATSDEGLNHWIAKCCKERKIPVNVVDQKEDSSFIMPAIIRRNQLGIAISSGGKSPAAVAYLKRKIQNEIPDRFEDLVAILGEYRPFVKEQIKDASIRKEAFQCLLTIGLANDGVLTEGIVKDVVWHLKAEMGEEGKVKER